MAAAAAPIPAAGDGDSILRAEATVVSPRLVERKQSLSESSIPNDLREKEEGVKDEEEEKIEG